ncbi:peptide MFS transporter [Streptomyces boncukensis]|uniref:MFS transporter n=1 Tax=Streptomyces boncukensis TaxID=2711219 RepID=A0A6G4WUT6_9ACTN|nr:oligopeptide:H+ symporter [Streptomyces boncukensis]NGO68763.1 MFS transporter [Streptomyces boncukensis]
MRWLLAVQVCERFAFYTMQGIIVLYMTQALDFRESVAYAQFASFSALLFLTPALGGPVADRWLTPRAAVLLGCGTLCSGYLVMALLPRGALPVALGLIIAGGGLFLPNMPRLVGSLAAAHETDGQRDSAMSLLFVAINAGGLVPPLVMGWVIIEFGYRPCFLLAAAFVALGGFLLTRLPAHQADMRPLPGAGGRRVACAGVGAGLLVVVFASVLVRFEFVAYTAVGLAAAVLFGYILWRGLRLPAAQRSRVLAGMALMGFAMVYVVLDQQAATSLTIFTEENVRRDIAGIEIPTVAFRAANPLFIIVLGPLLSALWLRLGERGRNPSVPAKFAVGAGLMGSGFLILSLAIARFPDGSGHTQPVWVLLLYFLMAFGELMLAPIGMAMVVKVSPPGMAGLMMGAWYTAFALAGILAGLLSRATVSDGAASGGPLSSADAYAQTFGWAGGATILIGVVLLVLRTRLNMLIMEDR